jgi:acetate kinase
MKILVINCGSSSIKYRVYAMPEKRLLGEGLVDRIAQRSATLAYNHAGQERTEPVHAEDHDHGTRLILDTVLDSEKGLTTGDGRIEAVGHRVVHGGNEVFHPLLIDEEVMALIEEYAPLAPLHNPPDLAGIRAAMDVLPSIPHVACFDTAFHRTIPPQAYMYAVPYDLSHELSIRRYGFHGIAVRAVAQRAAERLGRPFDRLNAIVCHLGNGCSVTAIRNGRSEDTSMGMTPLEGLMMGTRAGDMDPGIFLFLLEKGLQFDKLNDMLVRESGLLGISGISSDMRDVVEAAGGGNDRAQLAVDMFCYRVRKYIGAYAAVLGEVHALIFSGGIGEHAANLRLQMCGNLERLGIEIDPARNAAVLGVEADIAADGSPVRVFVIPANEELAIAHDVYEWLTI